jgi:hypothetical protein
MNNDEIKKIWNYEIVKKELKSAFENNSELELLAIIKRNTFLFYELVDRKYGVQPIFHEVSFGGNLRCDFTWLNDNSSGPEWVLLEIEKPNLQLFNKNIEPTAVLNHALEQVRSWRRYFKENIAERKRIFGAVARFRFIVVGGNKKDWNHEAAIKWRVDHNAENDIQIRSSDILLRGLKILNEKPEQLWSFAEHPVTRNPSELQSYWESYGYMDTFRKIIN